MASQFQSIAALVSDDTGTPEAPNGDGTQINSTLFSAIDAILNEFITRSAKTVGGIWTWESFGVHRMEAGGVGEHGLVIRNTNSSNSSRAIMSCQANDTTLVQLQMFSTTFTPSLSGSVTADGSRLVSTGTGLFALETVSALGFGIFPAGSLVASFNFANGPLAENGFGWSIKNSAGTVIPGVVISAANEMTIGSDNSAGMGDTVLKAGQAVRVRVSSGERAAIVSTRPEVLLGGVAAGAFQSLQLGSGSGTPISGQILFGTDNTGWQLRFGKNHAGSVTHLWKMGDSGNFSPVADNAYDLGTSTERIQDIWAMTLDVTTGCSPNADNTATLGTAIKRWQNLYCVNAFVNDLHFNNGWSFTEHDKLDIAMPGIALVDDEGELQFFIGKNKRFYTHDQDDISRIQYTRRTREERALR